MGYRFFEKERYSSNEHGQDITSMVGLIFFLSIPFLCLLSNTQYSTIVSLINHLFGFYTEAYPAFTNFGLFILAGFCLLFSVLLTRQEYMIDFDQQTVSLLTVFGGFSHCRVESITDYPFIVIVRNEDFGYYVCFKKDEQSNLLKVKLMYGKKAALRLARHWANILNKEVLNYVPKAKKELYEEPRF